MWRREGGERDRATDLGIKRGVDADVALWMRGEDGLAVEGL
jgi:hypothetical protein